VSKLLNLRQLDGKIVRGEEEGEKEENEEAKKESSAISDPAPLGR